MLRPVSEPFRTDGGLRVLSGNLGRAVIKISSVPEDRQVVEAPAIVFEDQAQVKAAFAAGRLDGDFVAVVRFQGPKRNGMPELHQLTPLIGLLQDRGQRVALVTDGRMSGASGKVPAAIHTTPEAAAGGPLARVRDGDLIRIDAIAGTLHARVSAAEWSERVAVQASSASTPAAGIGNELFALFRNAVGSADSGASVFNYPAEEGARAVEPRTTSSGVNPRLRPTIC